MTIQVKSELHFDEHQDFDPFDLISRGSVQLFHVECGGGEILRDLLKYEGKSQFQCDACGVIKFYTPEKAAQHLRRVLIHGGTEEFNGVRFVGAN